jgi:hypothetical protein
MLNEENLPTASRTLLKGGIFSGYSINQIIFPSMSFTSAFLFHSQYPHQHNRHENDDKINFYSNDFNEAAYLDFNST